MFVDKMEKLNQQMNSLKDRLTILVHIIFSTKNQEHFIDEKVAPLLYTCIEGALGGISFTGSGYRRRKRTRAYSSRPFTYRDPGRLGS